jgi:DNA-directed RNA polymerase subunit RPC12/RpoP
MAIQFSCSNCLNPIEVDDQYAEQMATCPYCRTVLKVPSTSTLESEQPISARPVEPTTSPEPSLPSGYPQYQEPGSPTPDPNRQRRARQWGYSALALAFLTMMLGFFYFVSLMGQGMQSLPEITPDNQFDPNIQQQFQAAIVRVANTQTMVIAAFGTIGFALATIITAVVALRYQVTWFAVTALILGALGFSCLSCMSSGLVAQGAMQQTQTQQASPNQPIEANVPEPNSEATDQDLTGDATA